MGEKPTYEELEQRVKALENKAREEKYNEGPLIQNTEELCLSNIESKNPHLVDGKYSIKDLIDIESLHKTLEKFSLATGFTTGFLEYPSQEILIATGWRDICTKFHRDFPESAKHCKESNIYLTKQLKELKELNIKPCENGLVDGATPIVIKGKHIANLATGQILFDKPDIERFKKQAEMYGYDLDAYLKALSEVPIVSEDQFKNALSFLSELAVKIAETGLNNLELKESNQKLQLEITERKKVEEALRESEKLYRLLADNVTDVIWVRDMNLRVTYVSPSITNQTGYTIEETMARTMEEALAPDSLKLVVEVFTEELEIEKRKQKDLFRSRTIELEINCKDGSTIWTEVTMSFLRDQLGNPTGVIGVTRDITDRKHLEAQLQQAQRMEAIGTLAGGVAHDLNNILSGIVSYPELILMDLPEGNPLRKPILTIQKSGEKAAVIVQDLLTLARRGVSISDVVNLNHIISEQLKSPEFEKLLSFHHDVQVKTDLEKDLLNIKGSSAHLSKSIMNIISNAAEAMPDGGTILISTENLYLDRPIKGYNHVKSGEYVTVTVSDTGLGIPEEDLKRIFEPFYTKKVMGRSGTGLGMAVVWGTVKDHKGYIDIQSKVGKGTTFTLYFPVSRKEVAKDESLLSIIDYMGTGELILVVDDVEEQREIATGMLRKLGYSATSVSSGEETVEYLKTNSADLIVLDMIMEPGINGLETYERIIKYHPNQKAIIASGFSETDDVKAAQILGVGKYIKKPYTLEKIGIAVRDELKE